MPDVARAPGANTHLTSSRDCERKWTIRLIEQRDSADVSRVVRTVLSSFGIEGKGYSASDAELDDMYAAYSPSAIRLFCSN